MLVNISKHLCFNNVYCPWQGITQVEERPKTSPAPHREICAICLESLDDCSFSYPCGHLDLLSLEWDFLMGNSCEGCTGKSFFLLDLWHTYFTSMIQFQWICSYLFAVSPWETQWFLSRHSRSRAPTALWMHGAFLGQCLSLDDFRSWGIRRLNLSGFARSDAILVDVVFWSCWYFLNFFFIFFHGQIHPKWGASLQYLLCFIVAQIFRCLGFAFVG